MYAVHERERERALRVRRLWRRLDAADRARARHRAEARADALSDAWKAVIDGLHPLARWLDGDDPVDALPAQWPDGTTPHQLLSSHPFTVAHPWSTPPTSPGSSSTPPG